MAPSISRPVIGLPRRQSLARRLATWLYHSGRRRGDSAVVQTSSGDHPTSTSSVTVVCISDTHNTRPSSLPPGDVLVHAGDLSQFGTFAEIQAQLAWLAAQPHRHKVVIAGNHDLLLDREFVAAHPDRELDRHPGRRLADLDWGGVIYLEHEAVDLTVPVHGGGGKVDGARALRIFGSPWTPRCGSWAFQYGGGKKEVRQEARAFSWDEAVPAGTDILLVHGPPLGHLDDGGKGCAGLLAEMWRAKPTAVVCGHIHAGRGEEWLVYDRVQAWYESAQREETSW